MSRATADEAPVRAQPRRGARTAMPGRGAGWRALLLLGLLACGLAAGRGGPVAAQEAGPGPATVGDLGTLERLAGEPPAADYGRLRIPALGVDAPIGAVAVGSAEVALPNPQGPGDIAWYDLSAWPGLGGAPGAGRNAVLSGHVNYSARVPYAGVRYRGPGVFARIDQLRPGDRVEVTVGDETFAYAVSWTRRVTADGGADWTDVLSAQVDRDSVTLVTCSGAFDAATHTYDERTVVRAQRVTRLRTRIGVAAEGETLQRLLISPTPGCRVEQIWLQEPGGRFVGYLALAPAFVNRGFPERLEVGRPYLQVCRYVP